MEGSENQQNASVILIEQDLESIDLSKSQEDAEISVLHGGDTEMADVAEDSAPAIPKSTGIIGATGTDIDAAYSKEHNIQHYIYPNDQNVKLIEEVKKHPVLYDHNHEHAKNLIHKQQAWVEVADKMGMKKAEAKKKFQSFYERFAIVYTTLRDPGMQKEQKEEVLKRKFIYYDHMLFFSDYVIMSHIKDKMIKRNQQSKKEKKKQEKRKASAEKEKAAKTIKSSPQQSFIFSRQRPQSLLGGQNFSRQPDFPPNFPMNSYNSGMGNFMPNMCGPYGSSAQYSQGPSHGPMRQQPPPVAILQRMDPPRPLMQQSMQNQPNQQQRFSQNNQDNFTPDDSHIDFFFRSVAQQVKKSNISDRNFLDLQARIIDALTCKLYGYRG